MEPHTRYTPPGNARRSRPEPLPRESYDDDQPKESSPWKTVLAVAAALGAAVAVGLVLQGRNKTPGATTPPAGVKPPPGGQPAASAKPTPAPANTPAPPPPAATAAANTQVDVTPPKGGWWSWKNIVYTASTIATIYFGIRIAAPEPVKNLEALISAPVEKAVDASKDLKALKARKTFYKELIEKNEGIITSITHLLDGTEGRTKVTNEAFCKIATAVRDSLKAANANLQETENGNGHVNPHKALEEITAAQKLLEGRSSDPEILSSDLSSTLKRYEDTLTDHVISGLKNHPPAEQAAEESTAPATDTPATPSPDTTDDNQSHTNWRKKTSKPSSPSKGSSGPVIT